MRRTNIMLTEEQHRYLKSRARKQGRTMGDLVREAINAAHGRRDLLERRKSVAMDAYQEGMISLGKLAEILGMDPVSTRAYLMEREIVPPGQDPSELLGDIANA
ncbi:MAG: UPF0175 family protein [Deltaproteobacteria bacterium]|nr:UPF0175 family protein [Deltaproteobacteria bacterium]